MWLLDLDKIGSGNRKAKFGSQKMFQIWLDIGISKVNAPENKMSDYAQIDSQTEKEIIYM